MLLTRYKNILIVFFIIFMTNNVQAQSPTPNATPSDDQISKDFWNALPNLSNGSPSQKQNIIQKKGLFQAAFNAVSCTKGNFGSDESIGAVQELMVLLTGKDKYTPNVDMKKINPRFYLLFFDLNYYLVDKYKDVAYWLVESSVDVFQDKVFQAYKITAGYPAASKDTWRFFFKNSAESGLFGKEIPTTVYDIDLKKLKFLSVLKGFSSADLNRDGMFELIKRKEVDTHINWYWVYRWENSGWVDSSVQYPDYYKTTVVESLEKLEGKSYIKNKELLNELLEAAKKGGPCCQ